MVPNKLTRAFGLVKLKAYQNREKIYFGLGIGCLAGGTILLCRGARRLDGVLDRHEKRMEEVDKLPEEERKRAKTNCYMQTFGDILIDFGPGAVTWAVGVAGVGASNYVLAKDKHELLDMLAMTTSTQQALYRRMESELGPEKTAELLNGVDTYTVGDSPSGSEEVETKEVKLAVDPLQTVNNVIYGYNTTRYFDENNLPFNMKNIQRAKNEFERRIATNGYIVAAEVKSYLGYPREDITVADWNSYKKFNPDKPIGQQLGWTWEELTKLEDLPQISAGTTRDRAMLYDIRLTFDFDMVMGKEMKLI